MPREEEGGDVVRRTVRGLAIGIPAPPLQSLEDCHVCILHDHRSSHASEMCSALADALQTAYAGGRVSIGGEGPAAAACCCVFVFLTCGLLAVGSPAASAAAAALRTGRRFIIAYETDKDRGGTQSVQDYIDETAPEACGVWSFTAFPWLGGVGDEYTEVCVLRLILDGIMDLCPPAQAAVEDFQQDGNAMKKQPLAEELRRQGEDKKAPCAADDDDGQAPMVLRRAPPHPSILFFCHSSSTTAAIRKSLPSW